MSQVQTAQRRSHAERSDLSDRLMLEAAIALINERGTDKTHLKEVGERAGYSRGLAGYRYGSKAGLFEAIVRDVGERWLADLKRVTGGLRGLEAISAALDEHCRFCLEASASVRAFYILWFESIGVQSPVKQVISGIHERRRADVEAWLVDAPLRKGLTPADVAGQFIASVLGIAYHWLANPDAEDDIVPLHNNLKFTMALCFEPAPSRG